MRALTAGNALCRRIFKVQSLAGMYQRMDCMRGERCFGKARQDQLELARIKRDVADRENPRARGSAGGGIDADAVVVDVEPPGRKRPEIGGEPEKGKQAIGFDPARIACEIGE